MDPSQPSSFVNLLTGDDTEQQPGSNVPNYPPNWQYPPHPYPNPQQQNAFYPHTPYPPPPPHAYYPPPQNVPNISYGGLAPPYPPQSTPPQPNNTPKSNEGGDNATKWTLEEDRRLVKSWINVSTNPITGADQKKSGFWTKVADAFNEARPNGATKKPPKTLNSRWNRGIPLVSKWSGCVAQAYRDKPSGTNEEDIIQNAQDLYEFKTGKKFNLMHWWVLLKDEPKWDSVCDQSLQASSKRLRTLECGGHSETSFPGTPSTPNTPINLDSDDTPTFEVGGIVRPMGQKAAKRKAKAKTDDPLTEVISKELSFLGSSRVKDSESFAKYVEVQAIKAQATKDAIALRNRDQRLKELKYEDKILSMDISRMCPEDQARYSAMKEEIRSRYRQSSSST